MLAAVFPAAAEPPPAPLSGADSMFLGTGTGGEVRPSAGLAAFGDPFGLSGLGGVVQPGWTITPSIGVQLLGTDNISNSATNRRGEFITTINPGLTVTANTASVTGRLSYQPQARIFTDQPDQNRIDQRFNGQARAVLLQETLFLDLRGFGTISETNGGVAPGIDTNTTAIDRRNQVQTTSLQASPYLLHRFGSFATVQVGYGWRRLSQDGNAATLPGATQPFFTSQVTTSHEGYGVVRTGEYFGRFAFEARMIATTYSSNGVLDGAHRYVGTLQGRYALTREIAALVEGGYGDQRYGGTHPLRIEEPIWAVGVRIAPDPDSFIIARYGHRDGYNSASLNASVGLGVRTRLFASYSDQINTTAQRTMDLLSTTSVDELGNPVDTSAGAPILVTPFTGSFLATQSSLMHLKRAIVSVSQIWERDTFTLSLLHDDRSPLTSAVGTTGFAQKGNSIGLRWTRQLAPALVGSGYVQYGRFESSAAGLGSTESNVYTVQATLAKYFSETLTGTLQYIFSNRGNDLSSARTTQNIILIGLRKTF